MINYLFSLGTDTTIINANLLAHSVIITKLNWAVQVWCTSTFETLDPIPTAGINTKICRHFGKEVVAKILNTDEATTNIIYQQVYDVRRSVRSDDFVSH